VDYVAEGQAGMNQDTYTIPGTQAAVVLQWPDLITTDDLEDIELWLDMMKRKLKRAVQKKEAEEARVKSETAIRRPDM
jgi:hypothetical protein